MEKSHLFKVFVVLTMKNHIKFSSLAVVLAVAGMAAFGSVAADSASLDFCNARWLWPAELGVATNTVVEFRQAFAADRASSARMAIVADTVYRVELNGRAVYWGRFPDVPPQRFYDVLPLGDVRLGENELKVSVYAQGANSFQTLPGDHGVMFAVAGAGVNAAIGTNTSWRLSAGDRRAATWCSRHQADSLA